MPRWIPVIVALATAMPPRHDLHLSHTRLVLEGRTVTGRIRVFRDDAEAALGRAMGRTAVRLSEAAPEDSAFARYLSGAVELTADGDRLAPRVTRSGRDPESLDGAEMWWFEVTWQARQPIGVLVMRHRLLFELFADQRNVVAAVRMPGGERRSLYFAASDTTGKPVF